MGYDEITCTGTDEGVCHYQHIVGGDNRKCSECEYLTEPDCNDPAFNFGVLLANMTGQGVVVEEWS